MIRENLSLWLSPKQVIDNCPVWVQHTIPRPKFNSPYFNILCEWLQFQKWDYEQHLETELEHGVEELQRLGWTSIVKYLVNALRTPSNIVREATRRCPTWIQSILHLPIFPVTAPNGDRILSRLHSDIFIPDSPRLNAKFKGKVKLLDFGDEYYWDILPLFKHSRVNLKWLSAYDNPETMDVRIIGPVDEDTESTDELNYKRGALMRYTCT